MKIVENVDSEKDSIIEEVDFFCRQHNINSVELKKKIEEIARNQDLKNYIEKKKRKETAIIVANGPSFQIQEVQNRKREDTVFCLMNNSPLSDLFWDIKPEYYTQADPLFFREEVNKEDIMSTINKLKKEVSWDMTFFVPYYHYERAKTIYLSNPRLHIIPFHDMSLSVNLKKEERNIMYHLGLDAPIVQNVVVGAIFCLINSGYTHIELYGVNHSWTTQIMVNDNNEVCLRDEHFFDNEDVKYKPWHKVSGPVYKMHEILRDLAQMFDSYWVLKDYAESEEVRIINKTRESFIDAFERG